MSDFQVECFAPQRYWRVTHVDGREWRVVFRPTRFTGCSHYEITRRSLHGAQLRRRGRLYRLVLNAVLDADASAPRRKT